VTGAFDICRPSWEREDRIKVASSGSVEGIRVGMGEGEGDSEGDWEYGDEDEDEEGDKRVGVDDWWDVMDVVVVVVDDAVNRSFNSAAKRTMSFALTISASRSFNASDMSVAVFLAEVSTLRRIPSIPDRPVFGSEVRFVSDVSERPFPTPFPYRTIQTTNTNIGTTYSFRSNEN